MHDVRRTFVSHLAGVSFTGKLERPTNHGKLFRR
jgi:hypothetical protein